MFVYILHSDSTGRFYVGETENVDIRLEQHNSGTFKGAHTSNCNDWQVKAVLVCRDRGHARKVEKHIKNMKSRAYIQNLISYPHMRDKLIAKY